MNETLKTINYRRSVRAYLDKEIPQESIDKIIHAAMRAPTAGNMMLYSIIEVKDQKKKDKLVTTCDNQPFIAKSPLVLIFLADMQRWYDYYVSSGVPEYCKEKNIEFRGPKESDLLLACCDAMISAQNAVIAAESLGIGSCYIGDIVENIETHREMFNLTRWVFPIGMLCFGFPKSQLPPEKRNLVPRFPQKFIHFTDVYNRIESSDFEEMYDEIIKQRFKTGKFLQDAKNVGQHYYLMKTGSEFSYEMIRSVKVAIKDWIRDINEVEIENN